MCVRENTSRAASVEFCAKSSKLCAQQTAILLSEKTGGIFDSLGQRPPHPPGGFAETVIGFIDDPKTAQGLYYLSSIAASLFFTAYAFFPF